VKRGRRPRLVQGSDAWWRSIYERSRFVAGRLGFFDQHGEDVAAEVVCRFAEGRGRHQTVDQAVIDVLRELHGRKGSPGYAARQALKAASSLEGLDRTLRDRGDLLGALEARERVLRAYRSLKRPRDRLVFRRVLEGKRLKEIGVELGVTESRVSQQLIRLKSELRRRMATMDVIATSPALETRTCKCGCGVTWRTTVSSPLLYASMDHMPAIEAQAIQKAAVKKKRPPKEYFESSRALTSVPRAALVDAPVDELEQLPVEDPALEQVETEEREPEETTMAKQQADQKFDPRFKVSGSELMLKLGISRAELRKHRDSGLFEHVSVNPRREYYDPKQARDALKAFKAGTGGQAEKVDGGADPETAELEERIRKARPPRPEVLEEHAAQTVDEICAAASAAGHEVVVRPEVAGTQVYKVRDLLLEEDKQALPEVDGSRVVSGISIDVKAVARPDLDFSGYVRGSLPGARKPTPEAVVDRAVQKEAPASSLPNPWTKYELEANRPPRQLIVKLHPSSVAIVAAAAAGLLFLAIMALTLLMPFLWA
jgi:DNA-directed RNA polymerase specialized sigma24 family protein